MTDERSETCSRCKQDTGQFPAWITDGDGTPLAYCHKDEQRPSCYTLATWDRTWAKAAFDAARVQSRPKFPCGHCDGTGRDGNCTRCAGSGYAPGTEKSHQKDIP